MGTIELVEIAGVVLVALLALGSWQVFYLRSFFKR